MGVHSQKPKPARLGARGLRARPWLRLVVVVQRPAFILAIEKRDNRRRAGGRRTGEEVGRHRQQLIPAVQRRAASVQLRIMGIFVIGTHHNHLEPIVLLGCEMILCKSWALHGF